MRFLAVALFCLVSFTAEAKQSPYPPVTQFNGDRYGGAQLGPEVARSVKAKQGAKAHQRAPVSRKRWRHVPVPAPRPIASEAYRVEVVPVSLGEGARRVAAQIIGGRPQGCPHRFCGCALALKIFGRIVPILNLAVNWVHKFQRSPPAPGMVAARHGHAFQLIAHVRGSTWQVWDANSGRGRTRIHERSIAGFVIVNPRSNS